MNDIAPSTELVPVSLGELTGPTIGRELAVVVFQTPGGVDAILAGIKGEVAKTKADVSTTAGRQEIRSIAYKIARSKTALDTMGKELGDDARAKIDAINADRRRIRSELDQLADDFRKPLTDFESRENARVAEQETMLLDLAGLAIKDRPTTAAAAAERIEAAKAFGVDRDWQEFVARYTETRERTIADLEQLRDRLAAEERRQREAEERREKQRQRDAAIAAQAAEQAKREAEAKAAADAEAAREAAERERAAIAAKAEEERRAAKARESAERERRERAEREREDAIRIANENQRRAAEAEEQRRADAEAAERRAEQERVAAAEREQRAREEAAEAERARAEAETQRLAEEAAARERNRVHRGKINSAIVAAIMDDGDGSAAAAGLLVSAAMAKHIVKLIASGKIPHVSISY